jgi:catechol 2,3-dioxygenase-like lactoylglutathione lyase family enzyme
MITNLAHVCFVVRDLEASLAFYGDVLGLTKAFDFVNEDGVRYGAYLRLDGRNFIELFQGDAPAGGGSYSHTCLEVDDIEATAAAIRAKGVEVTPVIMGMDGSWQAWFADPDGNRFELHQYTAESWQAPWV